MKKLFALMFLATNLSANALDLEIGVGQSYAQKAEDGIYYQERHPHELRLQGQIYTIGLTDKIYILDRPARWRVFGVLMHGLGGTADAQQDNDYDPKSVTGCISTGCQTFSRYKTNLSTRGFAATLSPEFNVLTVRGKPVIVSPEFGLHVYIPRQDEDVYTLDNNHPSSSYRYYHYKWGWNVGEVFGLGIEWGGARIAFRRWKINMVNRTTDTGSSAWITDIPSAVGEIVNTVTLDWRF